MPRLPLNHGGYRTVAWVIKFSINLGAGTDTASGYTCRKNSRNIATISNTSRPTLGVDYKSTALHRTRPTLFPPSTSKKHPCSFPYFKVSVFLCQHEGCLRIYVRPEVFGLGSDYLGLGYEPIRDRAFARAQHTTVRTKVLIS